MANDPKAKLNRWKSEAEALLSEEQDGRPEAASGPRWRLFAYFCIRVGRSFIRNRGPIRAAALAYTTVLALVPVLAVAISISAGLLKKESDKIDEWIRQGIAKAAPMLGLTAKPGEQQALDKAVESIREYVDNFKSGGLGAAGVLALIFVAISLLSSIEGTLNDIWGVDRGRAWTLRVVQYWTVISLGPMLLLAVGGLSTATHLDRFQVVLQRLPGPVASSITFGAEFMLPVLIIGVALAALYLLLPNTKVRWQSAVVGGVVASLFIQFNSQFSVFYASRVAREKSIYGSLAVIPLLLLGLYLSWLIVLLGAQVAYTFQNRHAYRLDKQAGNVHQRGRELAALRVMTWIGRQFRSGRPPTGLSELSTTLAIPPRLASQVLGALTQARLVVEVTGRERAFVPALPLNQISACDILRALRTSPGQPALPSEVNGPVQEQFQAILQGEEAVSASITLESLVERAAKG